MREENISRACICREQCGLEARVLKDTRRTLRSVGTWHREQQNSFGWSTGKHKDTGEGDEHLSWICRKSDTWEGAPRLHALKESAGWRLYRREEKEFCLKYCGISKLSRETPVICKCLNEASGIKGEGWGYINDFNGVKLQKGMSKLRIPVESC